MKLLNSYYFGGGYGYANYASKHCYVVTVITNNKHKPARKFYKTRLAANKRLYKICRRNKINIVNVKQYNKHVFHYLCNNGDIIVVERY